MTLPNANLDEFVYALPDNVRPPASKGLYQRIFPGPGLPVQLRREVARTRPFGCGCCEASPFRAKNFAERLAFP